MNTPRSPRPSSTSSSVTELVRIVVDGHVLQVPNGISVAAALAWPDSPTHSVTRHAIDGQPRAPFCGIGICQECRTLIDGRRQLSCQTVCRNDMRIETDSKGIATDAASVDGTTA